MKPIFVIPARGGSKGIPHKNIADLAGRPLIAYTIDAARRALAYICQQGAQAALNDSCLHNTTERIILSTDDAEIAACAETEGLKVPFMRPAHLSTDTAGSREVILHAMDYADAAGIDYDCVVLLQPTSPFRTGEHIIEAMRLYNPDETDMVVSVKEAASNPYYNCFETDPATGYLHISKGDGLYTRRQDAPPAWEYNGAIYLINPASLRAMPMGAFPRRIPFPMPAEASLDIDTPLDLAIACSLLSAK